MRASVRTAALGLALTASAAATTSLADFCTTDVLTAALPKVDQFDGIRLEPDTITTAAVTNYSATNEYFYPNVTDLSFCNVTLQYYHTGLNDSVVLNFWFPPPAEYKGRYLATGGGGLAINSGNSSLPGGVYYGAVAGLTDGGFGSVDTEVDAVFLEANGTINWQATYMFGYQAIGENTMIGKAWTANVYSNSTNSTSKVYAYYQACSEGGREGWSQVQHWPTLYDGVIPGAPAFRYGQQQVNHLTSNLMEVYADYYPPPCEMTQILNETIFACDPLDGLEDGVVARTDLCLLDFDPYTIVGTPYYCAAEAAEFGGSATPAQNGTVSKKAVDLAVQIYKGLKTNDGKQVYMSYQPSSTFTDAETQYNADTGEWELDLSGLGGEWIERFLNLQDSSDLSEASFLNYTYDTLRDYMIDGWYRYQDSLQTNNPDLSLFMEHGGKVLSFHGESDYSIPTASSVRYHESVRQIMYPSMSYNESNALLGEWNRLYLIPGATHCAPNSLEPNGPFPDTNLAVMIDWVEKGITPERLPGTVLLGENVGETGEICPWPLRPFWPANSTTLECNYDQRSIDTWHYDLSGAFKLPLY